MRTALGALALAWAATGLAFGWPPAFGVVVFGLVGLALAAIVVWVERGADQDEDTLEDVRQRAMERHPSYQATRHLK